MNNRLLAGMCAALVLGACVKRELTSDERLERATATNPKDPLGAPELAKVRCDDTQEPLSKAQNESRPEGERLQAYMDLYDSLLTRSRKFEEAMNRNPDLAYNEGTQELVAAREKCVQLTADVKMAFETYTRELVELPTVQEIKGGAPVVVARLDFNVLRAAIDKLAPDDREALLNRVANAEKKVDSKPESKKRGGNK